MMWSSELSAARERFFAIGAQQREIMQKAWLARQFPLSAWRALADAGFYSAVVEKGFHEGVKWCAAALEGFCAGSLDGGFCIAPSCHGVMGTMIVDTFANDELKSAYLDDVMRGNAVLAFAVTEPQGGTNPYFPECRLSYAGGQYKLNGCKWHITSAPYATAILAWVHCETTDDMVAVLVDRKWAGVSVSNPLKPAGARTSPVASVMFDEVIVPKSHIIQFAGAGKKVLTGALMAERILSPFPGIGMMQSVLDDTLRFARERTVAGRPIADHQYIQLRLTDMQLGLLTVESFARVTLDRFVNQEDVLLESSMLKIVSMNTIVEFMMNAIKTCGTYGLQEEAQLFSIMLDAFSCTVGGGTEEAHRILVFNQMVRRQKQAQSSIKVPGLWIHNPCPDNAIPNLAKEQLSYGT